MSKKDFEDWMQNARPIGLKNRKSKIIEKVDREKLMEQVRSVGALSEAKKP